jgi:hypothetical protein
MESHCEEKSLRDLKKGQVLRLKDYLKDRDKKRFASDCGISYSYLIAILQGHEVSGKKPTPEVAARISAAAKGRVTIHELLYPNGIPVGSRISGRKVKPFFVGDDAADDINGNHEDTAVGDF